jgi:DNA mismatch repair protein MutL
MARITILPDVLCNQIAAGEVVDRPAAVVKELLENSIDAGSTKIDVLIVQGGRKEIRIADNGLGMSPDDALMAIERHATSKIRAIEDLQSIQSLGFRGEALPSIAAVSRFDLVTREPDAMTGTAVRVDGGILKQARETGCGPGTTVTVRDLFFNIPARRKFLRSIDTELSHITDHVMRLAIAYPRIHLHLAHQDRVIYELPSVSETAERVGQVFGTDVVRQLRSFESEKPEFRIHGLMGVPELQRSNTGSLLLYVNGRVVWDRLLNRSILAAYESVIPRGRFPVVALFVEIQPTLVDVNVHPSKREVRFRRPGEILDTVREALRQTLERTVSGKEILMGHFLSPDPAREWFKQSDSRETQTTLGISPALASNPFWELTKPPGAVPEGFPADVFAAGETAPEGAKMDRAQPTPATLPAEFFSRMLYLGQLANSYLLLEFQEGLVIIDQHAAHERILYDLLTGTAGQTPSQRLARSVIVELLPREAAVLRNLLEWLQRLGFEIEAFDRDSFAVRAVPGILSDCSPEALLREFLASCHEEVREPETRMLLELAKSSACHKAVKANQKLAPDEVRELLKTLDATLISSTCPHGRPLWIKLTYPQLARLFQRS